MQLSSDKSIVILRTLVAFFLVMVAFFAIMAASRVGAQSKEAADPRDRLVTIYDRGQERVVVTREDTIGDALRAAGIFIDKRDRVEPSLDEEMVASQYHVNIYRARPVVIVDDTYRYKIVSAYQTPYHIAKQASLELYPEDSVELAPSTDIARDGMSLRMTIKRATAFQLTLYGKKIEARTNSTTVGEMLKEKDITLAKDDVLTVAKDAKITAGMTVEVWRNGIQTITEDQEVEFPVEKVQDANREVGFREIKTPGVKGERTVTYEIVMKNGQELSRKEIQSVVTKEPKKQVEIVGAKPSFSGDFAAALAKLRQCEAGGNYANKNNPMYRGAYQFSYQTWGNKYGIYDPADASPAQQDQAARELYERRGWQPWPHCGSSLPDTYR